MQDYDGENDNQEHPVFEQTLEDVELVVEFSGVEEIEDLQHHEGVEDKGEVA